MILTYACAVDYYDLCDRPLVVHPLIPNIRHFAFAGLMVIDHDYSSPTLAFNLLLCTPLSTVTTIEIWRVRLIEPDQLLTSVLLSSFSIPSFPLDVSFRGPHVLFVFSASICIIDWTLPDLSSSTTSIDTYPTQTTLVTAFFLTLHFLSHSIIQTRFQLLPGQQFIAFGPDVISISRYIYNTSQITVLPFFWHRPSLFPPILGYFRRSFISQPFTFGHETRLVILMHSCLFALTIVPDSPPVRICHLGTIPILYPFHPHALIYLGYHHGVIISSPHSGLLLRYSWPESNPTSPNLQVSPLTSLTPTMSSSLISPAFFRPLSLTMDEMSGHFIVSLPTGPPLVTVDLISFKYWI